MIGADCIIKYGFVASDTPDLNEPAFKKPGVIGHGVKVGANVVLMPGVIVKEGATLGACSQIRKDVGKSEIWYGNPAKKV